MPVTEYPVDVWTNGLSALNLQDKVVYQTATEELWVKRVNGTLLAYTTQPSGTTASADIVGSCFPPTATMQANANSKYYTILDEWGNKIQYAPSQAFSGDVKFYWKTSQGRLRCGAAN